MADQSVQVRPKALLHVSLVGLDIEHVIDAAEDIASTGQAGALDLARGIPQPGTHGRLGTLEVTGVDADAKHATRQFALSPAQFQQLGIEGYFGAAVDP